MEKSVVESIISKAEAARALYHRLVLVVGPSGSGKTRALEMASSQLSVSLINLNLVLAQRMLEMTERQRILRLERTLNSVVAEVPDELLLLDNTELLFASHLQADPLRLLQRLARSRTVVATWNGRVVDGCLVYASPEHPEYRRYLIERADFLLVPMATANNGHHTGTTAG